MVINYFSKWINRRAIALMLAIVSLSLILICNSAGLSADATAKPTAEATALMNRPRDQSPVMVDGRVLFRVGSIEGFSADVRADNANSKIDRAVATTSPEQAIEITTRQEGDLTTIRLDDQHLLTVTEGDFVPGVKPTEQARIWETQLQSAIDRAQQERTNDYQNRAALISVGLVLMAIAISLLLRWLRRYLNRQITHNGTAGDGWISHGFIKTVVQPALMLLQVGVWIAALFYFAGLFPASRYWRYQSLTFLTEVLTEPIFDLGEAEYSVLDLLKILVLAIGLWMGVRIVTALVRSRLLRVMGTDREIQDAIAVSIQFLLTGLGLLIILQGLGFDVSSLAILASVLGVGIGFGLQNIANNFISGLIIIFERPIRVGDFIKLGDLEGTVERIGARSTEIRTLDYVTIIVPNSEFVETKVVNWSHGHPVSRLHVRFGVAYGSNIRQVRASVLEAVQVHPEVLRYPQPQIWFDGFGDSSLDFDLLIWIREPRHQFRIRSDLYYLIEANLRRYQIEIPFPQRDLHLRSPQLDDLATVWHGNKEGTPPHRDLAPAVPVASDEQQLHIAPDISPCQAHSEELLAELIDCSILLRQQGELADSEIDQLIMQMRGANGVEIKARRYGLRTYQHCFVGSEAIDWLMQNQRATREEAIRIGQILVERGLIHHVTDEHTFEDKYLFYRFYDDEQPSRTEPT
ncbi:MAG: mechanosensitive ion channel domain-containing protein [Elainellaceae cyanobacterium]